MASVLNISDIEKLGIGKEEIKDALTELMVQGLSYSAESVLDVDLSETAALNIIGIRVEYAFVKSNQTTMNFDGKKSGTEFSEGIQDYRVGHAIYRCKVSIGTMEENEAVDYFVEIDRLTIHPDHRASGSELVFSTVRHIVEGEILPDAKAAWKFWEDFKNDFGGAEDMIPINGHEYTLEFEHKDGEDRAWIYREADTPGHSADLQSSQAYQTEDEAFQYWENTLDDLYPGEAFTAPAAPAVVVEEETEIQLLANEVEFEITAEDETTKVYAACLFKKGIMQDTLTFDTGMDGPDIKKLIIKKDRPTSVPQLKTMAQAYVEGAVL